MTLSPKTWSSPSRSRTTEHRLHPGPLAPACAALNDTDASQWQVILEADTRCVLVVPKGTGMATESLRRDVETSLRDVGDTSAAGGSASVGGETVGFSGSRRLPAVALAVLSARPLPVGGGGGGA